MTDNKKEQQRAELHRSIWSIANDLRGSVDGWDFKQYVLGMLFYRYIATCIMVLKKSKTENNTLFIDASKECVKITNSNKLTQKNMDAIIDAYTKRANHDHFIVKVANSDIAVLNAEIEEIVAREKVLRDEIAKIIAKIEVGE